jgi:hypothetical protein
VDSTIHEVGKYWGEDAARDQVKLADVPTSAPAFTAIGVDGRGNRWIMVDPGDDASHTWFDVFDSTGVYLGKVPGPPGLVGWRMTWGGDEMLAYLENDEGEPAVVKYRIQR